MNGKANIFVDCAEESLAFLCHEYGFHLDSVTADTNDLGSWTYSATYRRTIPDGRWQSATLHTTPDRGELGIDLAYGQSGLDSAEVALTVRELLEIESMEPNPEYSVSNGFGDTETMRMQYSRLATILQDHGTRFFEFDPMLPVDLNVLRKMPREKRERQQKDRKIEAALLAGEWARAVVYLEGLGSTKTRHQCESLKLALRNMGTSH